MPRLSVVVLTWNEERNIALCLDSLRAQEDQDFEVIVLDAASTDGTTDIVRETRPGFPVELRLEVAERRIPIGEARNRSVALAHSGVVAFLSADAQAAPDWTGEVAASIETADMVFGRQVHRPLRWTTAAAVRGLRYNFPEAKTTRPLRFASNVTGAFRRELLLANPFDDDTNAAEDTRLAARAAQQGFRAHYNPNLVVFHHDADTVRQEMRKNTREGYASGRYLSEIGVLWPVLVWGLGLVACAVIAVWRPGVGLGLGLAALWAPAIRRAVLKRHTLPGRQLVRAVLASPPFDLAFLLQYLRGLVSRRAPSSHPIAQESHA